MHTCVGAKVAFECRVARECAIALAADVAAHPGVNLHVLLQGCLRLETLPAQQAEDGHVRSYREEEKNRESYAISTFAKNE